MMNFKHVALSLSIFRLPRQEIHHAGLKVNTKICHIEDAVAVMVVWDSVVAHFWAAVVVFNGREE